MNDNKKNKRLVNGIILISLIAILFAGLFIFGSLFFYNKDIRTINKSIENLQEIKNDEERMMIIVKLRKDILNLSSKKKERVNNDKLEFYAINTSLSIKESVEWNILLKDDCLYNSINSISLCENIGILNAVKETVMPLNIYKVIVTDEKSDYNFKNIIDIPYFEISSPENDNGLDEMLNKNNDSLNRLSYSLISVINDQAYLEFKIHSSGYIILSVEKILDGSINVINKYISVIRIDYEYLASLFENNNLEPNCMDNDSSDEYIFLDNDYIYVCAIKFVSTNEGAASSICKIVRDINDINLLMSYLCDKNALFDKIIFDYDPYYMDCINIGIDLEKNDGNSIDLLCEISRDGIFSLRIAGDSYRYLTDKKVVDYDGLLKSIRSLLKQ